MNQIRSIEVISNKKRMRKGIPSLKFAEAGYLGSLLPTSENRTIEI